MVCEYHLSALRVVKEGMMETREYLWCGKPLVQAEFERDYNFEKRSHCDKHCAGFTASENRKRGRRGK